MSTKLRRYRGGCKQEQQNGEGLKVLYGTETAKGKSVGSMPCTSLFIWDWKSCTGRETRGEATDKRKQLGSENMSSETGRKKMGN